MLIGWSVPPLRIDPLTSVPGTTNRWKTLGLDAVVQPPGPVSVMSICESVTPADGAVVAVGLEVGVRVGVKVGVLVNVGVVLGVLVGVLVTVSVTVGVF